MENNFKPILLPAYKKSPPYGKNPRDWFYFFMKPHRFRFLLFAGLNLMRYSVFKSMPLFLGLLVGLVGAGAASSQFTFWIALFGLINFIALVALIIIIPAGRVMDTISKQVSLFGFAHYLSLPESWHESRASGEKLQRLLTARQSFFDLLENLFWHVIAILAAAIGVVISVTVLKAPLYYIALFYAMVVTYVGFSHITVDWMRTRYADYNKSLEQLIGGVYEFLVSTATVRFFSLRRHVLKKAGELEGANHARRMDIYRIVFKRWFLIDCVALFWIVLIMGLSSHDMIRGTITIAAYTAIISTTLTIWYELENFAIIYAKVIEQWEGFKRLVEILNQRPAIEDAPNAPDLNPASPDIQFKNISFEYHPQKPIIQNFTLSIRPGEKIGLIGPSGAGKTTIIKLLLRFYDVTDGEILIGGDNIRDVTQVSLQNHIAIIPQDIVLFNHPLLENIRYGDLDAGDDAVKKAAQKAHADDFILKLPQGYDTIVGERGVKLSGGQRQRIAIARAILKNSDLLILDEATSSLDSESEKAIQDSLLDLMKDKTVIAIAHRLSTIAHLDRLVVMDEGRIVEEGSHSELLQKNGLYARLWSLQSGGFIGFKQNDIF